MRKQTDRAGPNWIVSWERYSQIERAAQQRPVLNEREKQVEDAVRAGRVEHDIMHVRGEE